MVIQKIIFYVYAFFALIIGGGIAFCGGAFTFISFGEDLNLLIISLPSVLIGLLILYSIYSLRKSIYQSQMNSGSFQTVPIQQEIQELQHINEEYNQKPKSMMNPYLLIALTTLGISMVIIIGFIVAFIF